MPSSASKLSGPCRPTIRDAVQKVEPQISFRLNPPNEPNSGAANVEQSNGLFRKTAQRLQEGLKETRSSSKHPQSYWADHLPEINKLMNTRPSNSLRVGSGEHGVRHLSHAYDFAGCSGTSLSSGAPSLVRTRSSWTPLLGQ